MTSAAQIEAETTTAVIQIIQLMGSNFVWTDTDDNDRTLRGVLNVANSRDASLVNSANVEPGTFHCLPQTTLPRKFERITLPGGSIRTIQEVHEVVLNNKTVLLKMVLDK